MSKKTITALIKEWGSIKTVTKPKTSKSTANKITLKEPNSLRAQLATSPYASMLSSPLRRCPFYGRIFPSKFLLRFSVAWHSETELKWAFPTFKKTKGFGYYVRLQRQVLQHIQKGAYKAVFRGSATYRSDMDTHVEDLLFRQTHIEFSKLNTDNLDLLLPTESDKKWHANGDASASGYQCILLFDPSSTTVACDLDHEINSQRNIPCYNMHHFWTNEEIEKVKIKFNVASLTLAVPKRIDTVQFAEAMWRCKQFIWYS